MDLKNWIELVAAVAILVGPIAVIVERFKIGRGIGARSIQFAAVAMLIPTILIVALEKLIDGATIGTLVGALTGYLLSGVGDYKPEKKKKGAEKHSTSATP
jgi:hypothetical protein